MQEDSTWIMAIVTKYLGSDKHGPKYEVQDAEPQDDGQPGALVPFYFYLLIAPFSSYIAEPIRQIVKRCYHCQNRMLPLVVPVI